MKRVFNYKNLEISFEETEELKENIYQHVLHLFSSYKFNSYDIHKDGATESLLDGLESSFNIDYKYFDEDE